MPARCGAHSPGVWCVVWHAGHGFEALVGTYSDFTREGTNQTLLSIVGFHARLLLVVLDGLVPQQPDKLYHTFK